MANEKRLIDANALKDRFKLRIDWLDKDKHDEYTTGIWDGCLYDAELIDEAPTVDAVEVVRCEKCNYGHWLSGAKKYACRHLLYTGGNKHSGEHFCSYAERRQGECK